MCRQGLWENTTFWVQQENSFHASTWDASPPAKGHRAGQILLKAQNQQLSEIIRHVHFTIDGLKGRIKAQLSQHIKGKHWHYSQEQITPWKHLKQPDRYKMTLHGQTARTSRWRTCQRWISTTGNSGSLLEAAVRINKLADAETEQLRMKLSALSIAKIPPSNLSTQGRKAITSLRKDRTWRKTRGDAP